MDLPEAYDRWNMFHEQARYTGCSLCCLQGCTERETKGERSPRCYIPYIGSKKFMFQCLYVNFSKLILEEFFFFFRLRCLPSLTHVGDEEAAPWMTNGTGRSLPGRPAYPVTPAGSSITIFSSRRYHHRNKYLQN